MMSGVLGMMSGKMSDILGMMSGKMSGMMGRMLGTAIGSGIYHDAKKNMEYDT